MNTKPQPVIMDIRTALTALSRCLVPLIAAAALHAQPVRADGNPPERLAYQGFLNDANGNPLGNTNTGPKNYDVIFRIWSDPTAGSELWAEQQTITVDKGYFSVLLGEGSAYQSEPRPALLSGIFTNNSASDRYVEITVKGIGAGSPPADVTIAPRLRLLTSPYAFLARYAVNAQNVVNAAGSQIVSIVGTNVGVNNSTPHSALDVSGTLTATGLTVNGPITTPATINAGQVTAGSFSGSGAGLTALNAANLATGTVPDGLLSSNVAMLGDNQTFTGNNAFTQSLGIGTVNPAYLLDVAGPIRSTSGFYLGNTGSGTTWLQVSLSSVSSGYSLIQSIASYGYTYGNIALNRDGGSVGIGTASPAEKLDVRGNIKLGSSGNFYAASGEENLRIVRGHVRNASAGLAALEGSGFTVAWGNPIYYITFTTPFSGTPTVTTSIADSNVSEVTAVPSSISQNGFYVWTLLNGYQSVYNFTFIAVGPR